MSELRFVVGKNRLDATFPLRGSMKISKTLLTVCLVFALGPNRASAQTDQEINSTIQFNFLNPGARSLGFGGAFLALADDATAAFTNPAGLTNLREMEVSIEGRGFDFSHIFVNGGRTITQAPTGIGIDQRTGLTYGSATDRVQGVSFLSFVYPGRGWALAAYYRQAANFRASGIESQGPFVSPDVNFFDGSIFDNLPECVGDRTFIPLSACGDARLWASRAQMDLDVTDLGVSGAVTLGSVRLGLGVSFYEFSMRSETHRFFTEDYEPADFSDDNVILSSFQEGNGRDTAVNLGLLWKGDQWSAAAVFRQGPTFPMKASAVVISEFEFDAVLHLPDVFGFGLAFAPTRHSKISLDYDRVRYSQLTDDFLVAISEVAFATSPDDWKVDDADEIHIGFEYGWRDLRVPVFLRLGAWYDPEHRLRFVGDIPQGEFQPNEFLRLTLQQQIIANRAIFQAGEDEIHYAAGVGFRFGDRVQTDVAIDYSQRLTTAAISAVVFLGSR